ncbi:MAG TPA: LysR family transcriptional regulator [Sphingobium sp.]|jgi:DNA-binding transcriptional LysR family regulator|uniref:LysR family transcriptional regulator n=1 Tax=unclassified Sphingobium TaxID=2611147 RepID=UPI0007F4FD8D|nr:MULTISPECIES: LysR family transcriptional regulator [unclassified Sphingobium]OAN59143.1 LysR family transcriptional regulator [Sphingobium sp. TCM1]WIW89132.1 LysR family transcriptional regulator [Sphingobium sp. V4]HAF40897.1 LysR family transcriptional regulator [Sphingobium sp.]
MFDWDDLRVFLAVARARKVAPAARALGIDATTIARRLARLEKALDTELFEVGAGERLLTARGQELLGHAEAAESAALAAVEQMSGQERKLSGQVRLSVAEGFGTWVLAPGMGDFNRRHPGIRLDLITASGFLNPSKREADMAVMLARPQRGRLTVRRLGDYRLHLYASPAYLERVGRPGKPADLRDHALIGYVPEFIFSPELDYLDEVEAGLEANLRSTSIIMQQRMIAEGAGIGVLPDFIGRRDPGLMPLMADRVEITRSFWLVMHGDLRRLARIGAVADWLQERIETLKPIDAARSPR